MVVDFAASWCGPCKFMEPVVKDMAAKYTDVDFVKIDVDELSVRNFYYFSFFFKILGVLIYLGVKIEN